MEILDYKMIVETERNISFILILPATVSLETYMYMYTCIHLQMYVYPKI